MLRHEDVHNNSGIGVVAEGIIFDSGMCCMTWLSEHPTATIFDKIVTVKLLHGHEGKTEIIIEDQDNRFEECKLEARRILSENKMIEEKIEKSDVKKKK